MNHDLMAVYAASEIVELLTLCRNCSRKRTAGNDRRPAHTRDEDAFAERIRSACGHALLLRRLLPVTTTLSAIGAEMERRGEISVLRARITRRRPGTTYSAIPLHRGNK
uniref:Uncharacterized protein n=1 Tax=Klebsiella pneumoniae TaxID=573 RepID=A0A2P1BP55_KLEPN|nr:hypothetical protein [Klebsiella pneumoniae]